MIVLQSKISLCCKSFFTDPRSGKTVDQHHLMVTELKLDFHHLQGKEKIISNLNSLTHHEPVENTNF